MYAIQNKIGITNFSVCVKNKIIGALAKISICQVFVHVVVSVISHVKLMNIIKK